MNEDAYMNWYQNNFDENAIMYAEEYIENFDEWCLNRYIQSGQDTFDYQEEERIQELMKKEERSKEE